MTDVVLLVRRVEIPVIGRDGGNFRAGEAAPAANQYLALYYPPDVGLRHRQSRA